MSVWHIANEARENEGHYAALAVKAIQYGREARWYMEQAAAERALFYEFQATGRIISPLLDKRIEGLRHARTP